ncbi:MAG: hypothetical protein AAFU65_04765 [Pseudomonadota bacterium]
MTTGATQSHEPLFGIVFEGRFLPGRDPADAQARFADRFGDAVARRIFSQSRAVLKRDVSRSEAEHMQGVLADMGVVVALAPVAEPELAQPDAELTGFAPAPRRAAASMIERAGERSRARTVVRRVEPALRWQPESNTATSPEPSPEVQQEARTDAPPEQSATAPPSSPVESTSEATPTDDATARAVDSALPDPLPVVRRTRWSLVALVVAGLASLSGLAYVALQLL